MKIRFLTLAEKMRNELAEVRTREYIDVAECRRQKGYQQHLGYRVAPSDASLAPALHPQVQSDEKCAKARYGNE